MKFIKTTAILSLISLGAISTGVKPALAQTFEEYKACTCAPNNPWEVRCYGCNNYPDSSLEPNWSSDIYYLD